MKGRLAEAKVLAYFITEGFEPYLPFCDNCSYDLLLVKDKQIQRVSVKFTSTKSRSGSKWEVGLRNVSRRNSGKVAIKFFNSGDYDLLAIYIGPEDRVVVLETNFSNVNNISVPVAEGKGHDPSTALPATH